MSKLIEQSVQEGLGQVATEVRKWLSVKGRSIDSIAGEPIHGGGKVQWFLFKKETKNFLSQTSSSALVPDKLNIRIVVNRYSPDQHPEPKDDRVRYFACVGKGENCDDPHDTYFILEGNFIEVPDSSFEIAVAQGQSGDFYVNRGNAVYIELSYDAA